LESNGVDVSSYLKIASNAHIITDFHLAEDKKDDLNRYNQKRQRTSLQRQILQKRCPRHRMRRTSTVTLLICTQNFTITMNLKILKSFLKGAQGFGLDVDWGDYPYVTSSHCTVGGAILNGVPPRAIRDVWGVAKIYETYVGA
jgi:adenylosuccinate synthase